MLHTRTGKFPIGIRKGWSDWQKDLGSLIDWVKANELQAIDTGGDAKDALTVHDAGLIVGSTDLLRWWDLCTEDEAARKSAIQENEAHIAACAKAGSHHLFAVLLPADEKKTREENLELLTKGLIPLAQILEKHQSQIVIEGWPGPGALGCTPESLRAIFARVPSPAVGINFDPSHLIRMGIDPVRFVGEFGDRIYHVHGKDTELSSEALYEFGHEQPATLAKAHGFGSHAWRYTIPGQGCAPWSILFQQLVSKKYCGAVSIELEDENFCTGEEGEKQGFIAAAQYLSGC